MTVTTVYIHVARFREPALATDWKMEPRPNIKASFLLSILQVLTLNIDVRGGAPNKVDSAGAQTLFRLYQVEE